MKGMCQKHISNVWKMDKRMSYSGQKIRFDQPQFRACLQIRFHCIDKKSHQWKQNNGFHQPENQFLLAEIRLFLKNWISTSRKKSPNKWTLFQVDRKSTSTRRNEKFLKNIWGNGRKSIPLARKWVSTRKNKVCL